MSYIIVMTVSKSKALFQHSSFYRYVLQHLNDLYKRGGNDNIKDALHVFDKNMHQIKQGYLFTGEIESNNLWC
jgi:hypothetical protein